MRTLNAFLAIAALPAVAVATPASARPEASSEYASALSDTELSQVRGGFAALWGSLTPVNMRTILDSQSRDDLRVFGAIPSTMMDVWWSNDGAALIAANPPSTTQ